MKTSIKTFQDVNSLHDLRTYTGAVKKSGKPDLPTTAILGLYMRRNEKDRLTGELKRTRRRKVQLQTRLEDVEKEMNKLLAKATQTAVKIRGAAEGGSGRSSNVGGKKKGKIVLGY